MTKLQEAQKELDALKGAYKQKNYKKCTELVSKLKGLIIEFTSLPPFSTASGPISTQEVSVAREVLEYAVLTSLQQQDSSAFERHFEMLRPYYTDARDAAPPSPQEPLLTGLNLLRLLGENRISDFHTELEVLSPSILASPYVRQPLEVEQWLMEGSYSKVLAAGRAPAAPELKYFMSVLESTVRDEIASCIEKAYPSMSAADAARLLAVAPGQLAEYAAGRKWQQSGVRYVFAPSSTRQGGQGEEAPTDGKSLELINSALFYARELERIV